MAGEVTALGKKCRAAILLIEHIVQLLPIVLPLYLRARVAASLDQRCSSLKGGDTQSRVPEQATAECSAINVSYNTHSTARKGGGGDKKNVGA